MPDVNFSPNEYKLILFKDYLSVDGSLSDNTVVSYAADIKGLLSFLDKRGALPENFTEEDVKAYMAKRLNEGAKAVSVRRFIAALRSFVKFLHTDGYREAEDDPLLQIILPAVPIRMPVGMSEQTVEAFLEAPDLTTDLGIRDKAMLELLYACGLRVSELCSLKFDNLYFDQGFIKVRGKGEKERIIPVAERAEQWVEKYVNEVRSSVDPLMSCPYIFTGKAKAGGELGHLNRVSFWYRVKFYGKQLGLKSLPSPHTFRHAFATHMLNHNADLRVLQMLLGHSSLAVTQIYTHVALSNMHELYNNAHPMAAPDFESYSVSEENEEELLS